jgi:N-acetylglucosaminyldiphosphoundecaprenol N-acetyl-beta-D-mannosaminyltransferase
VRAPEREAAQRRVPSDGATAPGRVAVLGVPIDTLPLEGIVRVVVERAAEQAFFQISTVNLDFLVHGHHDQEVQTIFLQNGLNIPDGAPVAWAGRWLGARGLRRVAGADLVPELAAAAGAAGLRIFLLGGHDGAAREAARRLACANPGLEVETYEPPLRSLEEMDDRDILKRIDAAQPHMLFVAFGHPKQEKWIWRHRDELPMVAMGVGCSLDLIAGTHVRAPSWMQRVGLEWSYRMAREPRRLARRYVRDAAWMLNILLPAVALARLERRSAPVVALRRGRDGAG